MSLTLPIATKVEFPVDRLPLLTAFAMLATGALAILAFVSGTQAALLLLGGLLGFALYQASFGFTGGWRRFAVEGRSRAMRAQILMVALAALLFFPILGGDLFADRTFAGAVAPLGISVVFGALLFGAGMQLGGGCGSGTLFTAGGGSARMIVTLLSFIVGATVGTLHLPFWLSLPSIAPVRLGEMFGTVGGLAATLAALALVALLLARLERKRHGTVEPVVATGGGLKAANILYGPWPLALAAIVLALGNGATLLLAGHPWSVTYGFGLWGAKLFAALGVPVAEWAFWQAPAQATALGRSVLFDVTSVMNFGIILGAAIAAALAGRFAVKAAVPLRSWAAAVIGGLAMGYGARLSFGCNIGALFSGIASGSLHGWVWFAMAYLGSVGGIALRPFFALDGFKRT